MVFILHTAANGGNNGCLVARCRHHLATGMYHTMKHSGLYLFYLNAGGACFLYRENYLVGMRSFGTMACILGIHTSLFGIVVDMVMQLASASDHSRHED